jgi:lipopolysaccharide/colanic/teichoic acid biosynthesis glycosyltransferase
MSSGVGRVTKRLLEAALAGACLALLSPLLAALAIAVKAGSKGPVFYRSERVGAGESRFFILKFRTMVHGADRLGPGVTGASDPRLTAFGALIRRTKLDELPQLVNVLRGDMSFVGPRPEDPRYITYYTAEQRRLLAIKPGITSPASLQFDDEEALLTSPDWETMYVRRILPAKLDLELQALAKRSFMRDASVLARTAFRPFRPPHRSRSAAIEPERGVSDGGLERQKPKEAGR